MLDREKSIRDEIEKTKDAGGDLHLILAECLIGQGKYDEACENLLFCLNTDTAVRESAYPLLVDLLSRGECIDAVPHMTFEWLRLDCYIEPEKKKAMYTGIAFGTDKLDKIACALEGYVIDFGGDENVCAIYDRLEKLTFDLMPNADYYDYCYYEMAHTALCEAVGKGLDLSKLSDERLVAMCEYSEDKDTTLCIRRFIWKNRDRDVFFATFGYDIYDDFEGAVQFADDCISEKNYEALIQIYATFRDDCPWNYNDANDEFYGPIINCILESDDVRVVSDFIKANESSFGSIYADYRYNICEFVSNNYLDANGSIREEWGDLTEVFTMLVEMIFGNYTEGEIDSTFGCFNGTFVKNAFEACQNYFTDEALEGSFEVSDGELWFSTIYGYTFITQDKAGLLEDIRNAIRIVKEKYCN